MTPVPTVQAQMRMLEHLWWAARLAPLSPRWVWFQGAAVALGAYLVGRRGGLRALRDYSFAVPFAAAGAVLLGSGATWLGWLTNGARGAPPDVEVAGFGAIAGLVTGHWVASGRGDSARALDVLAAPFGVMIAIARTGCFFAGCDFGTPSTLPWALAYPPATPAFRAQLGAGLIAPGAARTLPVHPTQLYEVGLGFAVALLATFWPRGRDGNRFIVASVTYGVGRLVLDTFRGDLVRGGSLGLTQSQALALTLLGAAAAWRFRRARRAPSEQP